ncbi:MAG: methylenetetrahydrofolate--tRNA-(uracil(54)-C(5))-methyltransferase (FADH(2)-oxidizing) TrmFO [Clostridiales bacterium]|nr:methylenetetrahydrofolate--tRNA-(uracil(54)-C(5))-methyltransferase (FADH(2)-oxidizing) TrmFO [Clostridiales bacterium]
MKRATVVGAGLAGSEAAWQLARQGIPVKLVEMKPDKKTPAHHSDGFAELVCSNSLRSDRLTNGVGLLKEEMRQLSSLVMDSADRARVPAGGALAVDRDAFSGWITKRLSEHPLVEIVHEECTSVPEGPCIIATGPLTSDALADSIQHMEGLETLSFYDAAAPIVTLESLDEGKVFRQSRYGRGDDYLNCPMNEEEYHSFVQALLQAETAEIHGFEEKKVFEGCMPVESMARRGEMVLAFGPLKPVGLIDPRTGKQPYAVVQLRQDNAEGTLYNLVGFQTRLKFPEQKRIFGMIPGLEHAEFVRYGVMHRNTFLHSPGFLNAHFEVISRPLTYFAGQITGVEGYVESAASGLLAGLSLGHQLLGKLPIEFPGITAIGAMGRYVSTINPHFQPMNCTFGLIDSLPVDAEHKKIRNKQMRYTAVSERALQWVREWADKNAIVADATESE